MSRVLVFAPTGAVGSATARRAASLGAHLTLAMRDTSKTLPAPLDSFTKVKADLTDPESITEAVKSSKSTRAFIYLAHQSKDFMRSAIEALKLGGIEFVVFLSSRDVPREPADAKAEDNILAFIHGQVEINLREVFGAGNYAAIRPGAFASNLAQYSHGIKTGKVAIFGPEYREDHIAPEDIGIVAGTILATGLRGSEEVYIFGPQRIRTDDVVKMIAGAVGKTVEITPMTAEESVAQKSAHGIPKEIAELITKTAAEGVKTDGFPQSEYYEEGVKNVELYKGAPGQRIEAWIEENKRMFQ